MFYLLGFIKSFFGLSLTLSIRFSSNSALLPFLGSVRLVNRFLRVSTDFCYPKSILIILISLSRFRVFLIDFILNSIWVSLVLHSILNSIRISDFGVGLDAVLRVLLL